MKEFKTHQSSMLRDGCHPQFVALPGVGGVWGKCFVQPLIYLSDERYEHTLPYIKGEVEDYVIDEESAIVSKTTGKPLKTTVYKKTVKQLYPSLAQMKKADGFKANAAFFKLGFLDKNAVALGRQFKELLPVLWLKAGAYGPCPSLEGEKDVPAMLVLQQNHFAVLTDEAQYEAFAEQVNSEDAITTVYIVTDSEPGYRDMISGLHAENTYQLYRDYLDNFRINHGGR